MRRKLVKMERRSATLMKAVSDVSDAAFDGDDDGVAPHPSRLSTTIARAAKPAGVVALVLFAALIPLRVYAAALISAAAAVAAVAAYLWLPAALGAALSALVSKYALNGAVDLEFRHPRLAAWFARGDGAWRLHARLDVALFRFGQPRVDGVDWARDEDHAWCHTDLLSASDVAVEASMLPREFLRLPLLFSRWRATPKAQPPRPTADGGDAPFGAVLNPATGCWQHRSPLGTIRVEQVSLGEVSLAFEHTRQRLNVCAVGDALARGEVRAAARRRRCPRARALVARKFNRLAVEVVAARHLDRAAEGRDRLNTFAVVQVVAQQRRSRTMMMNGDPVYAFRPEDPFVLTEPSTCVHVALYDENYVGDALLGQWTTTAKWLALDPTYADGGLGVAADGGDVNDGLGWAGWVPLRDGKWRPFDAPGAPKTSDLRGAPAPGYPAVQLRLRWSALPASPLAKPPKHRFL